jgi:hypothetical protein
MHQALPSPLLLDAPFESLASYIVSSLLLVNLLIHTLSTLNEADAIKPLNDEHETLATEHLRPVVTTGCFVCIAFSHMRYFLYTTHWPE